MWITGYYFLGLLSGIHLQEAPSFCVCSLRLEAEDLSAWRLQRLMAVESTRMAAGVDPRAEDHLQLEADQLRVVQGLAFLLSTAYQELDQACAHSLQLGLPLAHQAAAFATNCESPERPPRFERPVPA